MTDKNAILADQRDDIRDGGHGDEIQKVPQIEAGHRLGFHHGVDELENNASTAEVMKIVTALRIHQRHTIRTLAGKFVMVENNDINPGSLELGNLRNRCRSAIHRNEELGIVEFTTALQPRLTESVAFLKSERKKARDIDPVSPKNAGQNGQGRGPIHVVVAIKNNAFLSLDRG